MSFILDALKKADAERQLGTLPGLRTAPPAPAPTASKRPMRSWPVIVAGGVGVAAIVLLILAPWRQAQPPLASTAVPAATTPSVPGNASALPGPAASDPAAVAASGGAIATPGTPPAAGRAPAGTQATVANDIPTPPAIPKKAIDTSPPRQPATHSPAAPLARTGGQSASPQPVAPVQTAQADQAAQGAQAASARPRPAEPIKPAVPASGPVMTMAELPPAIRAELPALAIGGSMYSGNPADRMLLIDKRMLHEGDEIMPGLVLEAIQPKSAILRYKGFAFRLAL